MSRSEDLLVATRASLSRLLSVLAELDELDDDAMQTRTPAGWTVAATLVHLAFYDDWVAARWRQRIGDGRFQDLPDDITQLANAAGERGWHGVPAAEARRMAREAARAVTAQLDGLPADVLEDAVGTNRPAMIDRSMHWEPHIEEIQRALA
ncbi:MAG: DinB family protein [Acidimicrobiales bacterium]